MVREEPPTVHPPRAVGLLAEQGLKPSEVVEELRRSGDEARPIEIFDCLEELFSLLTSNRLWHLVSRLARRGTASLDAPAAGGAGPPEPPSPEPDPEQRLLRKAASADLAQALATLPARDRLAVALRYEEALPVQEVAELTGLSLRDCERRLSSARQALRDALEARHLEPAAGLRAAR